MLPEEFFIRIIDAHLQETMASTENPGIEGLEQREIGNTGKFLWSKDDKMLVPESFRKVIYQQYHDHPTAGHPGQLGTLEAIRKSYWWPGIRKVVKKYVEGCGACQQFKINRRPAKPSLIPISRPTSTQPFAQVSMDMITNLPEIDGFDSILSVVDHRSTKGVILIPCSKSLTAEGTADLLLHNLFKRHGLLDKIISDRGPNFAANSIRELFSILGIESALSTSYHPQTDGTCQGTPKASTDIRDRALVIT